MASDWSYHPSEDQRALAGALDNALAAALPLGRLHKASQESAAVWRELDGLGAFTIGLGEDQGGSGLGVVEEALIVQSLGRQLAAPAVLATIGAAHHLRAAGAAIGVGTPRVAAAYERNGRVVAVEDGETDLLLLRQTAGASLRHAKPPFAPIDDRYWGGTLQGVAAFGEPLANLDGSALLRLRLLDAAALAGLAEAALEMAVAYAQVREQFGRPIGSFQAVKHACADMAIAARCARDQTNFAAVALDQERADAERQVESALLVAGTAALQAAASNIQIHGGIGFSHEADPHLLIKRAQLLTTLAGGLEAATERLANLPESHAA